jgi:hypothetical protein
MKTSLHVNKKVLYEGLRTENGAIVGMRVQCDDEVEAKAQDLNFAKRPCWRSLVLTWHKEPASSMLF